MLSILFILAGTLLPRQDIVSSIFDATDLILFRLFVALSCLDALLRILFGRSLAGLLRRRKTK